MPVDSSSSICFSSFFLPFLLHFWYGPCAGSFSNTGFGRWEFFPEPAVGMRVGLAGPHFRSPEFFLRTQGFGVSGVGFASVQLGKAGIYVVIHRAKRLSSPLSLRWTVSHIRGLSV